MTRDPSLPSLHRRLADAPRRRCSAGFNLIELMIGAAIGTVATLVIANVLLVSEGQRRTVTAGSDAQVNGSLSLYTVQRDVQMAGYGLSALNALGCEIRAKRNGATFTWTLAPVLITDGANGAPDSITVLGSASDTYAAPVRVVVDHPRQAANFFVDTTIGVSEGDLMLAVPPVIDASNWCSVFNVTGLGGAGGGGGGDGGGGGGGGGQGQAQGQNQVLHDAGNNGPWNQPGGQTIFPNAGYPAGSFLVNLGPMVNRTYAVSTRNALQSTTLDTASGSTTTRELFPGIVNLQAYYGLDTNADGAVDRYTATTPTSNAGWRQLLTVRMAIVARSGQFEKEDVTHAQPLWDLGTAVPVDGSVDCDGSKCVTLNISHLTDWKRYRYKVYDVVVPVRNMLWHL
jgi:type IV pilus assembly protein PilW